MCQEPKKLAELGIRNFCGDFNARNEESKQYLCFITFILKEKSVIWLGFPISVLGFFWEQ